jgi:hypothetical protein
MFQVNAINPNRTVIGSATFSLPRAALATHIFVEGRWKKLITWWTESETQRVAYSWYYSKTVNSCISPYNWIYFIFAVC